MCIRTGIPFCVFLSNDAYFFQCNTSLTIGFAQWTAIALQLLMHANSGVLYSSFQLQAYGGTGAGSQYNRNFGSNAFPTRDTMLHIDDWLFFEDANEELVRDRVNDIREVTTKYWKVPIILS